MKFIIIFLAIFVILSAWLIIFPIPSKINIHSKRIPNIKSSSNPTENPILSKNIIVNSPKSLERVFSPFIVVGDARVFENVVSIRLKSASGKVLFEGNTYASSADVGQFGKFEKEIIFSSSEKEGILEVYQASAKDGSEIDKVTVSLIFK